MNKNRTKLSIQERLARLEATVFPEKAEGSSVALSSGLLTKVQKSLAEGQSVESFVEEAVLAFLEDKESDSIESEELIDVSLSESESVSFLKKLGACSLSTTEVQSLDGNLRPLLEYDVAESNWALIEGWEENCEDYLMTRKPEQSLESWLEEKKENDLEAKALAWLRLGQ